MELNKLFCNIISVFILLSIGVVTYPLQQGFEPQLQQVFAASFIDPTTDDRKAPIVTSDGNVYVTWWSNKTGNDEVLIRASNDGGLTFGDKINLSNTTTSESVDAQIAADGDNVYISWWERNQTANEPVLRMSNDGGQTFGPVLQLSNNGTIGNNQE